MKGKIKKAVFPVAGFGTRFLPATKSLPKEMLPIVDKPVIQYLVEESSQAGIDEIVLITGRGKRAIEDYFDHSWELDFNLVEKDKHSLLKKVREVEDLANFVYIRQPKPKGDGDAILRSERVIGTNPFAVFFGDDIIVSEKPAISQLEEVFWEKGGNACILALEEVPEERVSSYGIIKPGKVNGNVFEITDFIEKPNPKDAPSNLAVIGRYICTPQVFEYLKSAQSGTPDGELRLADSFRNILKTGGKIFGVKVQGERYDTGEKLGYLKATVDFALKDKDLSENFSAFLIDKFKN